MSLSAANAANQNLTGQKEQVWPGGRVALLETTTTSVERWTVLSCHPAKQSPPPLHIISRCCSTGGHTSNVNNPLGLGNHLRGTNQMTVCFIQTDVHTVQVNGNDFINNQMSLFQ